MDTAALAIAEEQAEKDAAMLAALQEKWEQWDEKTAALAEQIEPEAPEVRPLNRAERRAQVAFYAMVLAGGNKQTPVRNATIIPRAERRRRKQHRRA